MVEREVATPRNTHMSHRYRTLESLISPLTWADFVSNYYQKAPVHIKAEHVKFEDLLTYEKLADLLNLSPYPHPAVKLYKEGKPYHANSADGLKMGMANGATLIFENLDRYHRPAAELLDAITAETWIPTRINVYLSQAGFRGYNIHYDTHDVFALQVDGEKEWVIYPSTTESPVFFNTTHDIKAPAEDSLLLRCTLKPGDVLYVPRGFWHGATAVGQPSLHLTLALFVRTGVEFTKWLTEHLLQFEEIRGSFPLIYPRGGQLDRDVIESWKGHISDIARRIQSELSNPSLTSQFIHSHIGRQTNRFPYNFDMFLRQENLAIFRRRMSPAVVDFLDGAKISSFSKEFKITDASYDPVIMDILNSEEVSQHDLSKKHDISAAIVMEIFQALADIGLGKIARAQKT